MSNIETKPKTESYAKRMFRSSLRSYFAPATAVLRAVRAELKREDAPKKQHQN